MEVFTLGREYPQLLGYENSYESRRDFDAALSRLAHDMIKKQKQDNRLVMYLHARLHGPGVNVVYRVIGVVSSPLILVLEVPEEDEYRFIRPDGSDYFVEPDSFSPIEVFPNENIREGRKYAYYGSYRDILRRVDMEVLPNKKMVERLSALDF